MATIFKVDDINKRMTEVAMQYLGQGLTFNCEAMRGSQGERGKVAVGNDKHVYIIYVHDDHVGDNWTDRRDVVKLTVEMYVRDDRNTYWLGKGETVYEEIFYQVNERYGYNSVYTNDEAFVKTVKDKQRARYKMSLRWESNWKDMKYDEAVIVAVIKAKTGRKRVFGENIVKVQKHTGSNCWQITYKFAGRQDSFYVKAAA